MKSNNYSTPTTEELKVFSGESFLISSGKDGFHEGGGGYYGNGDINDNDYGY